MLQMYISAIKMFATLIIAYEGNVISCILLSMSKTAIAISVVETKSQGVINDLPENVYCHEQPRQISFNILNTPPTLSRMKL